MSTKDLILVGGGGHCKSVIDVAEGAGWDILGILDTTENVGKKVLNYTIIGTDEQIPEFAENAFFIVTVGQIKNVDLRVKLHEKVLQVNGELATIIASDAHVSKHSSIGKGTVVMHKSIVNAGVKIGMGCIINTMANIEHDAVIGDYCHISTGVMVNGSCNVGDRTFIGSGSVLANDVIIPNNIIIGSNSFVKISLLSSGIYWGTPAKKVRDLPSPLKEYIIKPTFLGVAAS